MPWSRDNLPDNVKNISQKEKWSGKQIDTFIKVANNLLGDSEEGIAIATGIKQARSLKEMMETVNMKKEILSIGVWKGTNITSQILDDMVKNFNELKDRKPVPLRIGHTSDDQPQTKILAAGWVDSLDRIGNKLIANIRNTPLKIAEFIKKEFLKPVSIEFRRNWIDGETGKKFKNVLHAIALMGVTAPAVAGLGEFDISFSIYADGNVEKIEYQEGNDMPEMKELQEKINSLEEEKESFKKDSEKLKEFKDKLEDKDKELKTKVDELHKFKIKQEKTSIEEFIEKNSVEDNMKILPCEKERVIRILTALENDAISFSEHGENMTIQGEFRAFISGRQDRLDFSTATGKPKKNKDSQEFLDEEERQNFIIKESEKMMEEKNIEFGDAMIKVAEKLDKEEGEV